MANWDRKGRLQDWYANADFAMDWRGPTGIAFSRFEGFELLEGRGYRSHRTGLSFYTDKLRRISLFGTFGYGDAVNYTPGPGLTYFVGRSADGSFGFTLRPTTKLRWENTYIYSHLGLLQEMAPSSQSPVGSVFTNHLARSKMNYQFTRALSARIIVDYFAVLPNRELIYEERFKRLTGDVLITYLLNPFTALYAGYTDNYDNVRLDPVLGLRRHLGGAPRTSTARQFFVKLSHLLRF